MAIRVSIVTHRRSDTIEGMATDDTQTHVPDDRGEPHAPPKSLPGYTMLRFLGAGAYGEVWVARDDSTGRKVAIKFFLHKRSVDWSLISREVEKLVFLSADRFVVQVLDVGWEADPPYFVMEYMERGSLEEYLKDRGPLPVDEAVSLFRDVATGLSHAHSKGVLHCDLKPANLLLDQDGRPRLADFGQSRLADEQSPALGTLFYMAPEQADLNAVPDAGWDVYALGCLLHKMLMGDPPHRNEASLAELAKTESLANRLLRYRRLLETSPSPTAHRNLSGVDRPLAEILEKCIAVDPAKRFQHMLGVTGALTDRDRRRVQRPLWLLGVVGPLLLLLTMGAFGYRLYEQAINRSTQLATSGAERSNLFAAQGVARNVASELEQRYRALHDAGTDRAFLEDLAGFLKDPDVQAELDELALPVLARLPDRKDAGKELRDAFMARERRRQVAGHLEQWLTNPRLPAVASWFVVSNNGTMLATAFWDPPAHPPEGENFAYRTYFHGGPNDLLPTDRSTQPLSETCISAPFQSTASGNWKVAISTPIEHQGEVLGVLALTVTLGNFVQLPGSDPEVECALLIEGREGEKQGMVLQHPLFTQSSENGRKLPDLSKYRVDVTLLKDPQPVIYEDPLSDTDFGRAYRGDWIMASEPVVMNRVGTDNTIKPFDTGLMLLVQKRLDATTRPVTQLGEALFRESLLALAVVIGVVTTLWYVVAQSSQPGHGHVPDTSTSIARGDTIHSRETLEQPFPDRRP